MLFPRLHLTVHERVCLHADFFGGLPCTAHSLLLPRRLCVWLFTSTQFIKDQSLIVLEPRDGIAKQLVSANQASSWIVGKTDRERFPQYGGSIPILTLTA